jgi:hypothetical protein
MKKEGRVDKDVHPIIEDKGGCVDKDLHATIKTKNGGSIEIDLHSRRQEIKKEAWN